ncbi:hypothetical protein SPLC1_S202330 [Arthrospira platensis C1]|nr:hypothetical protein SPLC1_S202330 [Arthrospira platensis C1]
MVGAIAFQLRIPYRLRLRNLADVRVSLSSPRCQLETGLIGISVTSNNG